MTSTLAIEVISLLRRDSGSVSARSMLNLHGLGVEGLAVVELDAVAQLERQRLRVRPPIPTTSQDAARIAVPA